MVNLTSKIFFIILGVPMSIQWNPIPYYYPIQIAQFSLQHYSRYITGINKKIHFKFCILNFRFKF